MIVDLTATQYERVESLLDGALLDEFRAEVKVWGKTEAMRNVRSPFTFWEQVIARIAQDSYNKRGQKRGRVSVSQLRALKIIATERNKYARHPAWQQAGMLGWSPEILYGWRVDTTDGLGYAPLPLGPDWVFTVLQPCWEKSTLDKVTFWRPDGHLVLAEDRLASEALHRSFLG